MPKFRKKPVVIEAVQFTERMSRRDEPWPDGLCCQFQTREARLALHPFLAECDATKLDAPWKPHIHTLEGVHQVSVGDWIITGVKGERYPCKPDIFEATYDAVDAPPPPRGEGEG
jgi:hypothetical protein